MRHGESVANARRLITGRSDVALTAKGYLQAICLGLRLGSRYDYVWSSDLTRSRKTLLLAGAMHVRRFSRSRARADARLDERSLGDLEGTPRRTIIEYSRGDLTYAPRSGESYIDLTQRVLSFLVDLRREVRTEARVIIATHVGPMRIITALLNRISDPQEVLALHFDNAAPQRLILRELVWPEVITR